MSETNIYDLSYMESEKEKKRKKDKNEAHWYKEQISDCQRETRSGIRDMGRLCCRCFQFKQLQKNVKKKRLKTERLRIVKHKDTIKEKDQAYLIKKYQKFQKGRNSRTEKDILQS